MGSDLLICQADARHIPLPDNSVQCIVTSPPYWGLRKYAGAQDLKWEAVPGLGFDDSNPTKEWIGAFGLEPSIAMYVAHSLVVLAECRRVLRPDGVIFWNLGDSYASGKGTCHNPGRGYNSLTGHVAKKENQAYPLNRGSVTKLREDNLKPKDLCLIPARVALAAQEMGLWIRSDIIWAKPNPMPESCKDRPTDAYEHILMFTKSARYYWDADAVREASITGDPRRPYTSEGAWELDGRDAAQRHGGEMRDGFGYKPKGSHSRGSGDGGPKARARAEEGKHKDWNEKTRAILDHRNLRNVWMFATQPYKGAHFATFPEELPRRCILAASSSYGACVQCGAPWRRITHRPTPPASARSVHHGPDDGMVMGFGSTGSRYGSGQKMQNWLDAHPPEMKGWQPTCRCRGQRGRVKPCLILDPFAGSGTVGRVAVELNRRAVLLDLAYHDHADRRTRRVQRTLSFSE